MHLIIILLVLFSSYVCEHNWSHKLKIKLKAIFSFHIDMQMYAVQSLHTYHLIDSLNLQSSIWNKELEKIHIINSFLFSSSAPVIFRRYLPLKLLLLFSWFIPHIEIGSWQRQSEKKVHQNSARVSLDLLPNDCIMVTMRFYIFKAASA